MKKLLLGMLLLGISITAFAQRKLKIIYSNQNQVKKAHAREIKRARNLNFDKYVKNLKKENNEERKSKKAPKNQEITEKNKENTKVNSIETKEEMVYVTKTGKRYHKKSCRYSKHARKISLKKAKKLGLKPCKICES